MVVEIVQKEEIGLVNYNNDNDNNDIINIKKKKLNSDDSNNNNISNNSNNSNGNDKISIDDNNNNNGDNPIIYETNNSNNDSNNSTSSSNNDDDDDDSNTDISDKFETDTVSEEEQEPRSAVDDGSQPLTHYERLCKELAQDERCIKDFNAGRRIGFYRIRNELLGTGNFAKVRLGFHCLVKEKVAIKILDKTKLDEKALRLLSQEIASMEKIVHPVIVRIFEVLETLTRVYIVCEYATSGELFQKIIRDGKFSESTAKMYYSQILSGVQHLHENNIIHRDIKAENVFLSGNHCKIGDFGFSIIVSERDQHLNTFCGSPPYAAPELFKADYYVGRYVDIWALGILLFFMTCGFMPFRADTVGKLKRKILQGVFTIPDHISSHLRHLFTNIIQLLPSDRLTMKEIMCGDWLDGVTYPEPITPYSFKPPVKSEIDGRELSEVECIALKELLSLGISEEMMMGCPLHCRNNINGTYRVAMYQIERRKMEKQHEGKVDEMSVEETKPPMRTSIKSRFCALV